MNLKAAFTLFAIGSVVLSCSHKITPETQPVSTYIDYKLDSIPVSEINIPIRISLRPLYELVEKSVDTLFTSPNYPDAWMENGCDVRFKYSFRRSPMQMKAYGAFLDLGFTGYYKIIGSTRVCLNGTIVSPWTPPCRCGFNEPERKVNVSFTNSVSMLPDYRMKLSFKRNEPQALDKCEVCFWGQDITKQVMKGLTSELDAAKEDLEKTYGSVDLKKQFQQIWDQLNKSYSVYGLGWLQINPQRVRINNLYADKDSLNIYMGLSAKPVISFEKPLDQSSWVPNLGDFGRRPGFSIYLDARLNYDSLSRILNQHLAGKQFDLDKGPVKKTFVIQDCKLYGSDGDKLFIRVNFSGTSQGVVYFVGKPTYDEQRHIIEIKDLDFDIRSKNAFLKAADWLFNKKITNEINKYARFDLSAFIDSAKQNINLQLNKDWAKGVKSSGSIADIRLVKIKPLSQYLIIRSNCTGELSLNVESIPFSL